MKRGTNQVQRTLGAYQDCIRAMESAKKRGGVVISFASVGEATSFRKRCYRVRGMLIKNYEAQNPELIPQSPYDNLFIQISGAELSILPRVAPTAMRDLDGNEIDFETEESEMIADMPEIDPELLSGLEIE